MINENKKREPSPLAHLGQSGIGRRLADGPASVAASPDKINRARAALEDAAIAKSASNIGQAAPNKGGRPSTTGKPWQEEGISRALWYRRQKEDK